VAVDLVEGELLEDMTDETEENVKVGGFVEAGRLRPGGDGGG
jgi:uncharacterized protein (DUF342 family)